MVAITTGLSDFYKTVIIVLKTFSKLVPKNVIFRDFKNSNRDKFKRELERKINENSNLIGEYVLFEKTFLLVLNKYALTKTKILYMLRILYMTKTLRKVIMKRTD